MDDVKIPVSDRFTQAAQAVFERWNALSSIVEESQRGLRDVPAVEVLATINDFRAALVALDGEAGRIEQVVRDRDATAPTAPASEV